MVGRLVGLESTVPGVQRGVEGRKERLFSSEARLRLRDTSDPV